ncbi:coiled-coil domain-containing protein R3HCC1L-like [Haliotis rufescens]|uniref:coiled-coil domain-containing protein R3HCC1L-like n=1 Tax=Haliotis rufescens TaxID=6454 RepID=UPI00201EE887|nr:coiled-coil domain-containing protein R3HCC1L-like [Haliotis rufescens]XP_048249200.1 coiled-coil domain-containing protein R3HCC1L-like [Haliotis rufescens]XP_048249201.1 coiled-coil domain-containing protein R3HCC1L-like [Haliotis rufescens]XP_048249202.1 coiled-coil domain-containing protein R3HCC1L-like [Haliotis rufescens]
MSRPPEPHGRRGRGRGRGATRGSPSPSGLTTRESAPAPGLDAETREARAAAVKERRSLGASSREKKKPGAQIYVPRARRLNQEQEISFTQSDSQQHSGTHSLTQQRQVDDRLHGEPCDPEYRGQGDTTPRGHGDATKKCQDGRTHRGQIDASQKGQRKEPTESPREERRSKMGRKPRPEIQRYVPRARRQPQSDIPSERPVTPETWDERIECHHENKPAQEKFIESPKGSSVKKLKCDSEPDDTVRVSNSGERGVGKESADINSSNPETQESVNNSMVSFYSSANVPCVESTVVEPSFDQRPRADFVQGTLVESSQECSPGVAGQVADGAHSVTDYISDGSSISGSNINDTCISSLGSDDVSPSESHGQTSESSSSIRQGFESREQADTECTESQEDGHVDLIPATPVSHSAAKSDMTTAPMDHDSVVDVSDIPVASHDSPSQVRVEPDACMLVRDSNLSADTETVCQDQGTSKANPDVTSVGMLEPDAFMLIPDSNLSADTETVCQDQGTSKANPDVTSVGMLEPDAFMLIPDSNLSAGTETVNKDQDTSKANPDVTSVGMLEDKISDQDEGCVPLEETKMTKIGGQGHSEECDIQMEVDSSNQQMNGVASEVNESHQDAPNTDDTPGDLEVSQTSQDHATDGVPECQEDSKKIKKQLKQQALAALDSEIRRRSEDAESLEVERQLKAEAIAAENFADPASPDQDEEEDSWDKMFDDNGDCLDPSVMEELTAHVGNVKIDKPKINYLDFQPKEPDVDMNMYGHVIEIYDFPGEFLTRDLIAAFKDFMSRGFDIKWVDDTHALGVFASPIAAQDALSYSHPMLKVRSLSEASRQSKVKAKKNCEFLQPYKARPQTSASAARRLVSGALGLQSQIPREKREQERKQLKEAKEKRRKDRRLKQDMWDGSVGGCAMDKEG